MQWKDGRRSGNVEDRRGRRFPGGARGLGAGAVVLALIAFFVTKDPTALLSLLGGSSEVVASSERPTTPEEERLADFVSVVLADTEDTWNALFRERGGEYREPTLVLFRDGVESACGTQSSAVGPFYCPGDARVYLDLGFFEELHARFGAPGDFAQAYVIAHEVGHHVQNLIGATQMQARGDSQNQTSVRVELQADCFAGVWGHTAQASLQIDEADLSEALNAAHQIGDDTLTQGRADSSQFTHGSSAQRMRWFRRGFDTGDARQCDTFGVGANQL